MSYAQNNTVLESIISYTTIWSDTDWKKIYKYVNKQRFRIFRAESEGDSRKVRNLQIMLVRSPAALKVAIKRITQTNKGKRTPDIDGNLALSDFERGKLFVKIRNRDINKHKPKPAYKIQIPKINGKTCSLGISTITDIVYQELLRLALESQWEFRFKPISYGFRPARRVHDTIERIFFNTHDQKFKYVFKGDIKACFNTLRHKFIIKQLKGFSYINLIEKFLKEGYIENGELFSTNQGTPQGGLLSPLLANIASHRLENCLNTSYPKYYSNKGHTTFITCGKYRDVRYANDFPIFSRNEEDIKVIPNTRKKYLDNRDLILPKEKSGFTTIFKGFDFIPKPNQNDKHQDRWILTNPNTSKQLNKMTWTNIERHTMIKNNYSPLDKSKSEYFYKRRLSTANKFR